MHISHNTKFNSIEKWGGERVRDVCDKSGCWSDLYEIVVQKRMSLILFFFFRMTFTSFTTKDLLIYYINLLYCHFNKVYFLFIYIFNVEKSILSTVWFIEKECQIFCLYYVSQVKSFFLSYCKHVLALRSMKDSQWTEKKKKYSKLCIIQRIIKKHSHTEALLVRFIRAVYSQLCVKKKGEERWMKNFGLYTKF